MTFPELRKCLKVVAVVFILLATVAPVIYLSIGFGCAVMQQSETLAFSFNAGLFMRSLEITLGATVLCGILGFMVAIGVWVVLPEYANRIGMVFLALILIPAFVHVQSWIFFADSLINVINTIMETNLNFNGTFAVVLTMALSCLPVTAGMTLMALLSVPTEIKDMVCLDGPSSKTFMKIYFPYLIPAMGVSSLLVFLLNINDYGITSVFGVSSYALELFSQFSSGMSVYGVFFNGLPLMIICLVVLGLFGFYVSKMDFSLGMTPGENPFAESKLITALAVGGLVVAGLFILVPVGNLIFETTQSSDVWGILSGSFFEIGYGILVSTLAAVISFIPAIFFAGMFYGSKKGYWVLGLAAMPFLIPGPVLGLSLIKLWNSPLLSGVYRSPLMPVVALVAKNTFIQAIILSVALASLDRAYLENIRVHWPGTVKAVKCVANLIGKKCLAGMLIVFALSMGEFGVTLLIIPPGYQTLTIKIYNYLHYGASDVVAVLCLFIVVIVILVLFGIFKLLGGDANEQTKD